MLEATLRLLSGWSKPRRCLTPPPNPPHMPRPSAALPPHLLAVGQRRAHGCQAGGRELDVAVEGLHKELAPQDAGAQAGVQVSVRLIQQLSK